MWMGIVSFAPKTALSIFSNIVCVARWHEAWTWNAARLAIIPNADAISFIVGRNHFLLICPHFVFPFCIYYYFCHPINQGDAVRITFAGCHQLKGNRSAHTCTRRSTLCDSKFEWRRWHLWHIVNTRFSSTRSRISLIYVPAIVLIDNVHVRRTWISVFNLRLKSLNTTHGWDKNKHICTYTHK